MVLARVGLVMPSETDYQELVQHYEHCLEQHGANHKGVDWPNEKDMNTRFAVMLDISKPFNKLNQFTLLDLGCGYGALLDYLKNHDLLNRFHYKGIDLSQKMIQVAIDKHDASHFERRDILIEKLVADSFDFIIMNGLFTEKRHLSQANMEMFFVKMIKAAYEASRLGIAFNVMNHHVDWMRDDLFYLPFDRIVSILKENTSRHLTIRADYGLYEYTVYVYKQPNNDE